jgi:hypothetical protein
MSLPMQFLRFHAEKIESFYQNVMKKGESCWNLMKISSPLKFGVIKI